MVTLVEIGRQPAGDGDVLRRRVDEIVGQPGLVIDRRCAIEFEPARVMVRDDVDHQFERLKRFKTIVAERLGELLTQRRVLLHGDGEPRRAGGSGLYDHDAP